MPEQTTTPTATPPAAPTAAKAPAERRSPPRVDKLPPYRVLLHNDDRNDMGHVVETLTLLAALPQARAITVMLAAHTRGVALVTVTHKERAELYREQFKSRGLTVTIEPAE